MKQYLTNWLPRIMSLRQCGKKSNHGLNYDEGSGEFGLINKSQSKKLMLSLNSIMEAIQESDAITKQFRENLPKIGPSTIFSEGPTTLETNGGMELV